MDLKIAFGIIYGLTMLSVLIWVATHADLVEKFVRWMVTP